MELARRASTLMQCLEKEFNTGLVVDDDLKKRLKEEDESGKRMREEIQNEENQTEEQNKKAKTEPE